MCWKWMGIMCVNGCFEGGRKREREREREKRENEWKREWMKERERKKEKEREKSNSWERTIHIERERESDAQWWTCWYFTSPPLLHKNSKRNKRPADQQSAYAHKHSCTKLQANALAMSKVVTHPYSQVMYLLAHKNTRNSSFCA